MIATIIILILMVGNVFFALAKHKEPKPGRYNFWVTLICTLIELWLFSAAGLFDKFNI